MRLLGSILAILAVVVIGGGLALWLAAPNIAGAVRPFIVRQVESATGRALTIAGDFTMSPSLVPTVVAHNVALENAPWGSDRPMLKIRTLSIELRLFPLIFHREIVIDRLILTGASLLIEQDAKGALNWQSVSPEKPKQAEAGTVHAPPYVADVKIETSSIILHDLAANTSKTIAVDRLAWSAESATAPLRLSAMGRIGDLPVELAGQVGPIAQLLGASGKWTVDLTGRIQEAAVTASGVIDLNGRATDLAVTAKGQRVETLGRLLDTKLPALGSYEADRRIARQERARREPRTLR
jgi:uncharacterized protein involved in outer membrane biogenesis